MRQLIVAFSDQDVAGKIKALLISQGLPVRGICGTGAQVLQMAAMCEGGGVVVCPIRFTDMTASETMSLLAEDFDMLVLVTSRQQGQITGSGIFTLTQPSSAATILDTARQILETRQLRAIPAVIHRPSGLPSDDLKPAGEPAAHGRSTEDQKIIEQAKYLLMNRRQLSEADAHRYLQKRSMVSGVPLLDVARKVIMPD